MPPMAGAGWPVMLSCSGGDIKECYDDFKLYSLWAKYVLIPAYII